MPCSFAMRIEIELNSVKNEQQQRFSNPHAPIPQVNLATSRGPIWRISTCDGANCFCISWRSDFNSYFSSVSLLKRIVRREPSKLYSAPIILIPCSLSSVDFALVAATTSASRCCHIWRSSRSRGVARRSIGFQPSGGGWALSSTFATVPKLPATAGFNHHHIPGFQVCKANALKVIKLAYL
jgi:hypothetical protein